MNERKAKRSVWHRLVAVVWALILGTGGLAVKSYAASGTVYTCAVNRCYAHPVTGVIEDSGGEASYATGQGMAETCIYSNGILEVTDNGEYYLTIRMSMMDYTSGLDFKVQNVGDSGWQTPAMGVTGNGTDANGSTADICIQVPSENSIVRISMYVTAMDRTVIYYAYPSDYTEGNNTDMNATMVTEASGTSGYDGSDSVGAQVAESTAGDTPTEASNGQTAGTGTSGLNTSSSKTTGATGTAKTESSASKNTKNSTSGLKSSVSEAAKASGNTSGDSSLNSAEGLSLSTAEDADTETGNKTGTGSRIFQVSLAVVLCGLVLIGTVAAIVYFFRRNWRRWGGAEDDDE